MTNQAEIVIKNEESQIELYEIEDIKQKIYKIRGKQVSTDDKFEKVFEYIGEKKKLHKKSFLMGKYMMHLVYLSYWCINKRFRKEMFWDNAN